MDDGRPYEQESRLDLGRLSTEVLEELLVELMIVKYPGVEQPDIDRLLAALRVGAMDQVAEVEASIAVPVAGATVLDGVTVAASSDLGGSNVSAAIAAPMHKTRKMTAPQVIVRTSLLRCWAIRSRYSCMTTLS